MSLNDLIAQGGVQNVQQPNMLAHYAQMMAIQHAQNQNELAQYQMSTARRNDEVQNSLLRDLRAAGSDTAAQEKAFIHAGKAMEWAKLQEERAKAAHTTAQTDKLGVDILGEKIQQSRRMLDTVTTPEEYMAWHRANHADPVLGKYFASRGVTAESAQAQIQQALQQPDGFARLLTASKVGAEKSLENHFAEQGSGQQKWMAAVPKYGPGAAQIVPGTIVNQVADPNAVLQAKTSVATNAATVGATYAGQRSTAQTAANALSAATNPALQATLAGARETAQETAKADVAITTARKQEKDGAVKALAALNYNPATGTDDISELIMKSTSGPIQNIAAIGYGAGTGTGTSGKVAIGELETKANKLALDIAGGKLGAGISNTDRDFIVASLGAVANPNIEANVRAAAWKSAVGRLAKLSGAGGSAPITTAPALPPGFKRD